VIFLLYQWQQSFKGSARITKKSCISFPVAVNLGWFNINAYNLCSWWYYSSRLEQPVKTDAGCNKYSACDKVIKPNFANIPDRQRVVIRKNPAPSIEQHKGIPVFSIKPVILMDSCYI
jgi:hypothetical protein